MRTLVTFENPPEPFNSMVKKGTAGPTLKKIVETLEPEAVYFYAPNGKRGGLMIIDLPDPSHIPRIAEHFFLAFESRVEFHPCMIPEDLEKAGLDELGKMYS